MRQLSGGMKRRVLVAQALVHRPPVIVLDEPTAGVDVELRQTLWGFIARLNREGHTVLLTTHYLEEAEALCGRIAMLKQGQVVALERTSPLLAASGQHDAALQDRRVRACRPICSRRQAGHRAHRAGQGADAATEVEPAGRAARGRRASSTTWRSAAPTWKTFSCEIMKAAGKARMPAVSRRRRCSARRSCASGRSASRPWPRRC
jgi:ABC-type multidrug transport system ATPase subunit